MAGVSAERAPDDLRRAGKENAEVSGGLISWLQEGTHRHLPFRISDYSRAFPIASIQLTFAKRCLQPVRRHRRAASFVFLPLRRGQDRTRRGEVNRQHHCEGGASADNEMPAGIALPALRGEERTCTSASSCRGLWCWSRSRSRSAYIGGRVGRQPVRLAPFPEVLAGRAMIRRTKFDTHWEALNAARATARACPPHPPATPSAATAPPSAPPPPPDTSTGSPAPTANTWRPWASPAANATRHCGSGVTAGMQTTPHASSPANGPEPWHEQCPGPNTPGRRTGLGA